ncbi:MAG: DUF4956 domain-containing protein [Eggerthellaceae bacterium]
MPNISFDSIFGSSDSLVASVSAESFLLCSLVSLVLGVACAGIYMFRNDYSKSFAVTLALLPLTVQAVITLVNGNLGAGVAVMGVFSLVRFRSIPGSAKDIGSVFFAMAIGLATGMGYLGFAVAFTVIVGLANFLLVLSPFGSPRQTSKVLRITVPEDLAFDGVFDETLRAFATEFELQQVQTTNMGSLYQLEYRVRLREKGREKDLIDQLRCLNGNLRITLAYAASSKESL